MIYALRWLYNDLQRFRTALERFTTVYNGSHTTVKKIYVISLIEDVNHCELIEIYSLAHVNRKKQNIPKQQNLFLTFCLNASSKTIL